MSSPPSPASTPASDIPPMYTPGQLRALRIAVVVMGVILAVGFAVVIGRIVWLVNQAPPRTAPAAGTAAPARIAPASLPLPKGAHVRHLALSGDRLAVHFEGSAGSGVLVVDLGTGTATTLPIVETAPAQR